MLQCLTGLSMLITSADFGRLNVAHLATFLLRSFDEVPLLNCLFSQCPNDFLFVLYNNKPGRFSNKKKGHSGGFYQKYGHFWPAFHNKIDESFFSFFSLTLVLLDPILLSEVQFWKMNQTTEKLSPARYARTVSKVVIFLVKSDTVRYLFKGRCCLIAAFRNLNLTSVLDLPKSQCKLKMHNASQ